MCHCLLKLEHGGAERKGMWVAFKNLRVASVLQMRKEEPDSTTTKRGNLVRISLRAYFPPELSQENSTWLTSGGRIQPWAKIPGQMCDLLGLTMGNYKDFTGRCHGAKLYCRSLWKVVSRFLETET